MSDEIQNFRIKYIIDDSDLDKSKQKLKSLTAEEAALKKEFDNVNQAAKTQSQTIQDGSAKAQKAVAAETGLINNLKNRIDAITAARDRSNNPVSIQRYNRLLDESREKVDKLTASTKQQTEQTGGLNKMVSGLGPTIVAAFSVAAVLEFGKKIIEVTSDFQKLEAVLTNTLGSKSAAQDAMALIKDFAAKTNFSVLQLTDGFVKLANQGFVPTRAELVKLADLANSTGKGFDQLVEAILDAQTGEFERLKEFGIKAKDAGDQISFTFKNQTTLVDKNSESIKNYVLGLGELKGVAGSTAAISETLGGQISNLGDSFDKLFASIGNEGTGIISGFIQLLSNFTNSLAETISFLANPVKYAREAAKEAYNQAVNEQKEYFEKRLSADKAQARFEVEVEILKVQELAASKKKFTEEELTFLRTRLSALALIKQEFDEKEKKDADMADKNKIGLIKALTRQIAALKKDEEEAVTEEEIRGIQAREKIVQAELDRLLGKANKQAEDEFNKKLKVLSDEEQFEIRRAKLLDASEGELYVIQGRWNKRKEELFKDYNKTRTSEYKDIVLKNEEIEKSFTDFLFNEKLKQIKTATDAEAAYIADKIAKAEKAKNEAIKIAKSEADGKAAIQKQFNQQLYQTSIAIENAIFDLKKANLQQAQTLLQQNYNADINAAGENAQKKSELTIKYNKEQRKIQREQAVADKEQALFTIAIQTATAIIKAAPVIPLMALAAASGAVQAALVAARPIPKFNKGSKSVPGADTGDDSIIAMLRPGEGVMPVDRMKDYRPTFDAVFDRKIPKNILNDFVVEYTRFGTPMKAINTVAVPTFESGIKQELKDINKTLKTLPVAKIEISKSGLKTFVQSGNSETEFVNDYFRN